MLGLRPSFDQPAVDAVLLVEVALINCRCHSMIASCNRPGFSACWVTRVRASIVASLVLRPGHELDRGSADRRVSPVPG